MDITDAPSTNSRVSMKFLLIGSRLTRRTKREGNSRVLRRLNGRAFMTSFDQVKERIRSTPSFTSGTTRAHSFHRATSFLSMRHKLSFEKLSKSAFSHRRSRRHRNGFVRESRGHKNDQSFSNEIARVGRIEWIESSDVLVVRLLLTS